MNTSTLRLRWVAAGWALALLATSLATSAAAHTARRFVQAVPQPTRQAPAPGVAGFGMPNPAGLPSPVPAGLPSPLPHPEGLPSPTIPHLSSPGVAPGSPPIDMGVAPQTAVMGAVAAGGVPATRQSSGAGSGPYTALQIAQSFLGADTNHDGELTRAEAQRLTIMPYSFEEMDRNYDGVISRFEYEDGVR